MVYKEKDSDGPVHFWTVEGNATHSVQLTSLGKYVLYEMQVLAFTRMGDGRPSSPPILERTLDDVPGPPVGILFPEVRTTSVRLIWQSPAQPNGIILGQFIRDHVLESLSVLLQLFSSLSLAAEGSLDQQFSKSGLRTKRQVNPELGMPWFDANKCTFTTLNIFKIPKKCFFVWQINNPGVRFRI